ncbi:MAG TPA: PTS sugar transporter subunit IIA [Phycisphaerae bacterium]|nr:PTS sugar transporter subunit IIA [Phycisphaerales bacterium]HNO76562.1 PTS sugar transporter subunit IIA [Phycisphaerae bacterium]
MKLSDILSPESIRVPLASHEKIDAITELVDVLDTCGKLTDKQAVLRAVLEREETRSTGIGFGLAVPHGKSIACTSLVMALGLPETPIDFGSSDGEPVELIALLASPPDKTGPHIQALARISRLMLLGKFRKEVLAAKTPDEVYAILVKHEE